MRVSDRIIPLPRGGTRAEVAHLALSDLVELGKGGPKEGGSSIFSTNCLLFMTPIPRNPRSRV